MNVESQIVCILGMHRSGTSLTSALLQLLGVYLGPEENLMKPAPDNPKGYWENQRLTDINDAILHRLGGSWHEIPTFASNWANSPELADLRQKARTFVQREFASSSLWGWKDPRTCLTLPFWQTLLPPLSYVICLRNPVDVARSLEYRDRFTFEKSIELWLTYLTRALEHTARHRRMLIFYEDVVTNCPYELERLAKFLRRSSLTEASNLQKAVTERLDLELQHNRSSITEIVDDPKVSFHAKALFLVLRAWQYSDTRFGLDGGDELGEIIERFSRYALCTHNEQKALTEQVFKLPQIHQRMDQLRTENAEFRNQNTMLQCELENRDQSLSDVRRHLHRITDQHNRLSNENATLHDELQARDQSILDVQRQLSTLTAERSDFLSQNQSLQNKLQARDQSLSEMQQQLELLSAERTDFIEKNAKLQNEIEHWQEAVLANERRLKDAWEALNRIYVSRGWKALTSYYRVTHRLLPPGSARRRFAQQLLHVVRDPESTASNNGTAASDWEPSFFQDFRGSVISSTGTIAACTIISKNYLAFARTLADSFHKFHPNIPFFVLLVDRIDGYFRTEDEKFHLLGLDQLNIPDLEQLCFKYSIIELNTAVKPFFLAWLFDRCRLRKLIFFDPDILITRKLSTIIRLLDKYSVVLIPHITEPINDDHSPNEIALLQAGIYNLGFIALAQGSETQTLLSWWKNRLYNGCLMAPERGMHVDQKWIDFVPVFFERVCVLRDPSYNVAYWNLHSRAVAFADGEAHVGGAPCHFFHFSGFDPTDTNTVSKYQNRLSMRDIGQVAELFKYYSELVLANGHELARRWPYAFDTFDNGVKIPAIARRMYHALGERRANFGNPFSTESPDCYLNWLNEPADGDNLADVAISRLWRQIHVTRSDLQAAFPDVFGIHRQPFLHWIANGAKAQYEIDDCFIPLPLLKRSFGVNLTGYFRSEKGVGEAGRATARALQVASIPYVLNDVVDLGSVNRESSFGHLSDENPYAVNLIHVNADQIQTFTANKGEPYFRGRYNIGYWFWELSQFPEEWSASFGFFDELWAPTIFVQDAISSVSPIPVVRMPLALSPEPQLIEGMTPRDFGLPNDCFLFLFILDFASVLERKNPLGLIDAFTKAFCDRRNVILAVKTAHSEQYPSEAELLKQACTNRNVLIIDRILSRNETNTLLSMCDCYVSLHRSEGFGLPIAEAMTLGKPVIVTGYSGNMDFTTHSNSYLVDFKLVEIDRDYGPYRKGWIWADPDVEHAAELMRYVYKSPNAACNIGKLAKQTIWSLYEPKKVSEKIKERLSRLALMGRIHWDAEPRAKFAMSKGSH